MPIIYKFIGKERIEEMKIKPFKFAKTIDQVETKLQPAGKLTNVEYGNK